MISIYHIKYISYNCRFCLKNVTIYLNFINIFVYLLTCINQEELNEKMAVMVFIHGGAFNIGSASPDLYSPDYLIDENVIVVTINYRLNVLGK